MALRDGEMQICHPRREARRSGERRTGREAGQGQSVGKSEMGRPERRRTLTE